MITRSDRIRQKFLDTLRRGFSVKRACEIAGITRGAAMKWRNEDGDFAQDWAIALEEGTERLEDAAVRRGVDSSDLLLMFMLKARKPDKYRENFKGGPSAPVVINLNSDDSKL